MPQAMLRQGHILKHLGLNTTGFFFGHMQEVPTANWCEHPQLHWCTCRRIFPLDPAGMRNTDEDELH